MEFEAIPEVLMHKIHEPVTHYRDYMKVGFLILAIPSEGRSIL